MRNIIKILIPAIIVLTLVVGCSSANESEGKGQLQVLMTDAPANFTEVNVNIVEVLAHYTGNGDTKDGWIQLNANAGFYDLLKLQNGLTEVIADSTTIPVGKITQMRLILGDDNYAVEIVDSVAVEHPLLLSSQDETGLKINLNSDILDNQTSVITLDFDAGESIIELGTGEYKLKPVIKVKSVVQNP
ncbi:MAG: DUF4382 domain-containing protein [Balneolaceae bacterium]